MTTPPDLDLDLIRCFLTVVESGGFTQASKRLHITQSGITLKIKRLEEQLKCRLFRRTVKPLELSSEGEIILGYACRLLDLNHEMVQRVAKPKKEATLRLGVVDHFGPQLLPQWLAEFKTLFPKTKIIGWKFEVAGRRPGAHRSARRQLAECATDFCVANGPAYGRGFGLVSAREASHFAKKKSLFTALANIV